MNGRGEFTYSYTVENHRPASSTNTVLTVALDRAVRFVSATQVDECTHSRGTVTCRFDIVNAGAGDSGSITVQSSATASADFATTFSVDSNQLDQDPGNNSVTVVVELDAPPEEITLSSPSSGDDFVELSWMKPADNGSPITGYELQRKEGNGVYAGVFPAPEEDVLTYSDKSVVTGTTYGLPHPRQQ